ncbi:MAG: bifunctional lysylphosphatidylglycerol flippase/synthetase MprF [Phycisphaerae bacterium]|nr:bifunctional lysylphosphatidylglycerol flippase/synthetase MprF [Phycisphaerae bacterium]
MKASASPRNGARTNAASDGSMRLARLVHLLGPTVAVLVFAGALWVMHRELHAYHFHEIVRKARELPSGHVWLAVLLTALGYASLTAYDALGFLYIRRSLPYPKIALTSFVAYAFSHNLGFAALTGSAVRYRLYSGWGFSAVEIARVAALTAVTFFLGFLTLCGMMFTFRPVALPASLPLPAFTIRLAGFVFLGLLGAYLAWSAMHRPFRIRSWEFPAPPVWLSVSQIAVSCVDWALAASVLYVLLPGMTLSFSAFLSTFLLAQIVGLASHVPGGLGVFESAMLLLLRPAVDAPTLIGSLLVFRATYYLLPLAVAVVLMGGYELARRRLALRRVVTYFEGWTTPVAPPLLAFTVFVGGAILLFSGSTPTLHGRLAWLRDFLPLPIVEFSHFLGSLAGAGLLVLARAIQRRLDIAYPLTIALLAMGVVASLLKGLDYEEAIALTVMLVAFIPCRRHFYRKAALIGQRFTFRWAAAILIVLLSSAWLGLFSYKHVDYSTDLWWHFSYAGDASRFLRTTVGIVAVVLFFAIARLMRPARRRVKSPTAADIEKAAAIIAQTPRTMSNFALLGDKSLLFNDECNAFVMYGVQRRSWIALGDPIGPTTEHRELVWRFHELCDRHGGWTVIHQVASGSLPMYVDVGLTPLKIGENARVLLQSFSLEGHSRKQFRQVENRFERDGCTFEIVPREQVPPLLPEFREVSDAWLADKNVREKRFAISFFDEAYLSRYAAAVVRQHGRILAFANIWSTERKDELSIDLMRYVPGAPNGVMDFLFSQLMLWGRQEGYQWFDLGMAPLSGLESHPLAPVWNRIGNRIFRHGEYFFNYQGLREYKDKFEPVWEPRYLVYPGGLILPNILLDFAALVSGGLRGVVAK